MPNAGMYDGTTLTTRKMEPIPAIENPWPTASWMDGRRVGKELDIAVHEEIGPPNRLNPDWTEALIGLPLGWTDPDCDICRPFTDWPMGRWPTPRRLDGSVKGDQFHGDWGEDLKSRLEQYGSDVMLNSAVRMVGGPQHDWEPPRITDPKMPNRIERLAVIGNAVSPQVAARIWRSIT